MSYSIFLPILRQNAHLRYKRIYLIFTQLAEIYRLIKKNIPYYLENYVAFLTFKDGRHFSYLRIGIWA